MNKQDVINNINQLKEYEDHFRLSVIINSKIEFEKNEFQYSSKMAWYVHTADLIIKDDKNLTFEEKEEFLKMHIFFTETFNKKNEKINVDFIVDNNQKTALEKIYKELTSNFRGHYDYEKIIEITMAIIKKHIN